MGKRKELDSSGNIDIEGQLQPKKHKKHKHKKHKKKRSEVDGSNPEGNQVMAFTPTERPVMAYSPVLAQQRINEPRPTQGPSGVSPKTSSKKKKGKGRDSETSSDEERWLDAIQSGKLEEVDDELKKIKTKDPKLMTARQRAMLERKGDALPDPAAEQLLALPTGYREKVMTPEMIKKAALKSQKRKQLLDEKREKDKKRTMERLLKKQDSKNAKQSSKRMIRKSGAIITYCNNQNGISIMLPPGMEFPLSHSVLGMKPVDIKCGVRGCLNLKRYSCSKTGLPVCSLACYQSNLLSYSTTKGKSAKV